jgi:bifunctional UDP-N-acetylglucosamine pyrophosphorylase / glucosamine-1-phosphate N-acetyltransferase
MVDLVLEAVRGAGIERPLVVVNPEHQAVRDHLGGRADLVLQENPRGTGHALMCVPPERLRGHDVLIVNGDMPLIRAETLTRFLGAHRGGTTIASTRAAERRDGRIVRRDGAFERIVEWKDATASEREIDEVNAGLYCFDGDLLLEALGRLRADNAAGELYLTDAVQPPAEVFELEPEEAMGVNDRHELVVAEHALTARKHRLLFAAGVTLRDTWSVFIDWDVEVGEDTVIEPFTILRGRTRVGSGCLVGPYTHLTDTEVGDGCRIEHSRLDGCRIGAGTECGPFVRIRPGTEVAADVHLGSFAEINRTRIGSGSKVPHFSYLGDAVIGENVNIGAGTITANYDGSAKNATTIEDGAFVGVATMLRAPVKLGRGSKTGAGSVVLHDVAPGVTVAGSPAREIRRKG